MESNPDFGGTPQVFYLTKSKTIWTIAVRFSLWTTAGPTDSPARPFLTDKLQGWPFRESWSVGDGGPDPFSHAA